MPPLDGEVVHPAGRGDVLHEDAHVHGDDDLVRPLAARPRPDHHVADLGRDGWSIPEVPVLAHVLVQDVVSLPLRA